MKRLLPFCALLFTAAACSANGGGGAPAGKADLGTDDQKTFYALGMTMGNNLTRSGALNDLTPDQTAAILSGISDSLGKKTPQVEMPIYGPKIQQMMQARAGAAQQAELTKSVDEKKRGATYEEAKAKEEGAQKLPSGLIYKTVQPGSGASPTAADTVKVNYEGKLIDGTVFDASDKHGGPATFPLGHVIPCWTEGVAKMKLGEKAQLVCPSSIAYGDQGHPPTIPGGSTLTFQVELLAINPKPEAPQPGAMNALPPGMKMPPGVRVTPGAQMGGMRPMAGPAGAPPPTPPPAPPQH